MVKYLESHGVEFRYNTKVENVEVAIGGDGPKRDILASDKTPSRKSRPLPGFFFAIQPAPPPASSPYASMSARKGEVSIDLMENDLVFITNGGCVENSTMGSQNSPRRMESGSEARRWLDMEAYRRTGSESVIRKSSVPT